MLSNECHACENYIEFPDQGIGQEIRCPHCGAAVVLTASGRTTPAQTEVPVLPPIPILHSIEPKGYAKGEDLRTATGLENELPSEPVVELHGVKSTFKIKLIPVVAVLGIMLAVGVALLAARRNAREAAAAVSHEAAIAKIQGEAALVRAPKGLFGAKWLMSTRDVQAAEPAAKQAASGMFTENRAFYDRPALIGYHLTNDTLLLFSVTFTGPGSATSFNQIQTRLVTEYGRMPAPKATNGFRLLSIKRINHFFIEHGLADSPAQTEQIFFYLGKAANPRLMPKAKLPP